MPALAEPATPQMATGTPASVSPSEAVLTALTKSQYTWRTVSGLAHDTGLEPEQVRYVLEHDLGDEVLRAASRDAHGRELYASKTKYDQARSFGSKVLSVLSDRIR